MPTVDNANRLTGTMDPGSRTVGYTLDNGGRVTELTRQDGSTVDYGYDHINRVTSITDSAISATATTIGYDDNSNVTSMTLSNTATVAKVYDVLNRLSSVTNKNCSSTTLSSYSYSYDEDSDRTGVTEDTGDTVAYTYDHLHRLTDEVRTGTGAYDYSYTLDNAGNRSTWTDNTHSTSVSYTYSNSNHMTAAGSYTYGYDNDGNRTTSTIGGTTTTSTFDYEDRLTAIGTTASYAYIGASTDRYSKTVSGTTTLFLYDGSNVDEEMQGGSYTAIYGDAAEKLGSTKYWMLQDGQGSTRKLLDSSQAVQASYITDSYGNSVSSSGTAANPFKWNGGSGYYSDAESGLQKVGARYYEPATGRWLTQDNLLIAGSPVDSQALNRYLYCESAPAGSVDPDGHFFIAALLFIAAVVLIAVGTTGCSGPDQPGPGDAVGVGAGQGGGDLIGPAGGTASSLADPGFPAAVIIAKSHKKMIHALSQGDVETPEVAAQINSAADAANGARKYAHPPAMPATGYWTP